MKIEVLGPGCPKCKRLAENVASAVGDAGLDCQIEKITDITKIVEYGVLSTPALVIDGEVRTCGKVLSVEEIRDMIV